MTAAPGQECSAILASVLQAGDDGGIADSDVEEFLRLYDQLSPALSAQELDSLKEQALDAARSDAFLSPAADTMGTAYPEGCGSSSSSSRGAAAEQLNVLHQIRIREMDFSPAVLNLLPGQTVECIGAGTGSLNHSVEIYNAKSKEIVAESPPVRPGKSWKWTCKKTGEFVLCSCIYSFMKAQLLVAPGEVSVEAEEGAAAVLAENSSLSIPLQDASPPAFTPITAPHTEEAIPCGLPRSPATPPALREMLTALQEALPAVAASSAPPASPAALLSVACPIASKGALSIRRQLNPRVPAPALRQRPAKNGPQQEGTPASAAAVCEDPCNLSLGYDAEGEEDPSAAAAVAAASNSSQVSVSHSPPADLAAQPSTADAERSERGVTIAEEGASGETVPSEVPGARARPGAKGLCNEPPTRSHENGQEAEVAGAVRLAIEAPAAAAAPPARRQPHLYRCKRCKSPYTSLINLQRCHAWHDHVAKAGGGTSGQQQQQHNLPPSRSELMSFWESLGQPEATALLDLSTPGETGELILQEAEAAGLNVDMPALGDWGPSPPPPAGRQQKSKAARSSAYSAATPFLLAVAGGRCPPLSGEQLFAVLEKGSEGLLMHPGAWARGSLADMILPSNICASLALLLEKRLTEAWAKQAADKQAAKQQEQVQQEVASMALKRRNRGRKRVLAKARKKAATEAQDPPGANEDAVSMSTTMDDATTTDGMSTNVCSEAEQAPAGGTIAGETDTDIHPADEPSNHASTGAGKDPQEQSSRESSTSPNSWDGQEGRRASSPTTPLQLHCASSGQALHKEEGVEEVRREKQQVLRRTAPPAGLHHLETAADCAPPESAGEGKRTSSAPEPPIVAAAPASRQPLLRFGTLDISEVLGYDPMADPNTSVLGQSCWAEWQPPTGQAPPWPNPATISTPLPAATAQAPQPQPQAPLGLEPCPAHHAAPVLYPPPPHVAPGLHRHIPMPPNVNPPMVALLPPSTAYLHPLPVAAPSSVAMGVQFGDHYLGIPAPPGGMMVAVPPPPLPVHAAAASADETSQEPLPQPVPHAASQPSEEDVQQPNEGSREAVEGSQLAEPRGQPQAGDSLKEANEFFAGLLRTMQANSHGGQQPAAGEALASLPQAPKEEEEGGDAAAKEQGDEEERQDGAGLSSPEEPPHSQRRAVFDPDLARRLFQQRWQHAVADISNGLGCRHASTVH